MNKAITSRRDFLNASLLSSAGTILAWHGFGGESWAADAPESVCVTVCNHWSYSDIGWQLGIESCILSVTDAMEIADRPPHVKTCINMDARAYELIAEKFPEVAERLSKYLAEGKVELIGGSYGQPLGTMYSGESNIRQIVVGRETIRKALGYEMVTFLEEEDFTHPQIPQILAGTGFRYASLAQLDTWGRQGCPVMEFNAIHWKGIDGTAMLCVPKNALSGKNSIFASTFDPKQLAASTEFKKLAGLGKPLILVWEEFGWDSDEDPAYLVAPAKYQTAAPVEFITLGQYLDKYGSQAKQTIYLPMDAWDKVLACGVGGDQLRVFDRKVDGLLLAAELFDAVAASLGYPSQVEMLEKAWRDLLTSQSHGVGLCEYSRWQGYRMATFDRSEDFHNFTWGAIGYNHLDAARKQGEAVLDTALRYLGGRVNTVSAKHGQLAVGVFNPHGRQRSDVVATGRVYPVPPHSCDVTVKDRRGCVVPSQIVKSSKDPEGNLVMADVAFLAHEVPPAGYDTYYLDFSAQPAPPSDAGLRIDESKLTMENNFVRVGLDPTTGGLASLVEKLSGREMIDGTHGAFPRFTGRPNPVFPARPNPTPFYDSAKSKARVDWLAKGPLWATVRAQHDWPFLKFETRMTLGAGLPYVEVTSRLLAYLPPLCDASPQDIKEGYWFSFLPSFPVKKVLRDFPFGVEETKNPTFHALTFVDLLGKDRGLLLLHIGTQYFKRDASGAVSNLVMREWESHFAAEYGWPPYAEYRHALMPHSGNLTNADRLRAVTAFSQPLIARVGQFQAGDLPASKGFVTVTPAAVRLSALRKKAGRGLEIRVVEVEGRDAEASVELGFPVAGVCETNLLGAKVADVAREGNRLNFAIHPWKIRTFELV